MSAILHTGDIMVFVYKRIYAKNVNEYYLIID